MATSSPTRFVIFPAILFLIVLIPLYLSPINRNQNILLHLLPTHSNHSETTHQTFQTSSSPSLLPKNDSADGVPSTSTDGARATNEIRKRFREKMSHVERVEEGLASPSGNTQGDSDEELYFRKGRSLHPKRRRLQKSVRISSVKFKANSFY
ncbi:hypothetical protein AAG906_009137 [Vitis piasezkii]